MREPRAGALCGELCAGSSVRGAQRSAVGFRAVCGGSLGITDKHTHVYVIIYFGSDVETSLLVHLLPQSPWFHFLGVLVSNFAGMIQEQTSSESAESENVLWLHVQSYNNEVGVRPFAKNAQKRTASRRSPRIRWLTHPSDAEQPWHRRRNARW